MDKLYEENYIRGIANAIRRKNGLTDTYNVSQMESAIDAIPSPPDMTVTADQLKLLISVDNADKTLRIVFCQTVAYGCTIDWGDGTTETSGQYVYSDSTAFTRIQNNLYTHIYSSNGYKVVTVTSNSGNIKLVGMGGNSGTALVMPPEITNAAGYVDIVAQYHAAIIQIAVGDNVDLNETGQYAFARIPSFSCNRLFTPGITTLPANWLTYSKFRGDVIIPDTVTTITYDFMLYGNANRVIFPAGLTNIQYRAFSHSSGVSVFDFTAIDLVNGSFPVTIAATTFDSIGAYPIMLFKNQEVYDVVKVASNWSSYASNMHYVGE